MDHVMWICGRDQREITLEVAKQTDFVEFPFSHQIWLIVGDILGISTDFDKIISATTQKYVFAILPINLICGLIYNHLERRTLVQ